MRKLKILLRIVLTVTFLMFFHPFLFSQNNTITQSFTIVVPQVMLVNAVDASGSPNAITLEMTTSAAGSKLQNATGTTYAQVSSIIAPGQNLRIQASYDQIPVGTTLQVTGALPSGGNGGGVFGNSNTITLSTTAQDLITGIGSCYTNTGPGDGYKLNWQLSTGSLGTYSSIAATSGFSTTVTLTITTGG
jgi:hypothetical protein